jgi:hypothetical protein
MSRLSREARARYEGVWQRLRERAIALDGDPFDEGKNPHYDAYPVELSMNLDDVHRYVPVYPFFSFSFLFFLVYISAQSRCSPIFATTSVQCARHPRVPRAPAHGARLGDGRSDHHALRRQYSSPPQQNRAWWCCYDDDDDDDDDDALCFTNQPTTPRILQPPPHHHHHHHAGSFQCFKMDAVVPGAQGEALPPSVPASPYLGTVPPIPLLLLCASA